MELNFREEFTCKRKNQWLLVRQNLKYTSTALYQTLQTTKMNFERLLGSKTFKNRHFQFVSMFFKFVHPFLLLYLLCFLYLLLMF